jgi:hypothetical protein
MDPFMRADPTTQHRWWPLQLITFTLTVKLHCLTAKPWPMGRKLTLSGKPAGQREPRQQAQVQGLKRGPEALGSSPLSNSWVEEHRTAGVLRQLRGS